MSASAVCLALSYRAHTTGFTPRSVQQAGLALGSLCLTFGHGLGFASVVYAMPGELLSPADKVGDQGSNLIYMQSGPGSEEYVHLYSRQSG